jgi:hypothetical protein
VVKCPYHLHVAWCSILVQMYENLSSNLIFLSNCWFSYQQLILFILRNWFGQVFVHTCGLVFDFSSNVRNLPSYLIFLSNCWFSYQQLILFILRNWCGQVSIPHTCGLVFDLREIICKCRFKQSTMHFIHFGIRLFFFFWKNKIPQLISDCGHAPSPSCTCYGVGWEYDVS